MDFQTIIKIIAIKGHNTNRHLTSNAIALKTPEDLYQTVPTSSKYIVLCT